MCPNVFLSTHLQVTVFYTQADILKRQKLIKQFQDYFHYYLVQQ